MRVEPETSKHDRALTKALTTIEALSAVERALLREMRAVAPAGVLLRKIKAAKAAKEKR